MSLICSASKIRKKAPRSWKLDNFQLPTFLDQKKTTSNFFGPKKLEFPTFPTSSFFNKFLLLSSIWREAGQGGPCHLPGAFLERSNRPCHPATNFNSNSTLGLQPSPGAGSIGLSRVPERHGLQNQAPSTAEKGGLCSTVHKLPTHWQAP